MFGKFEKMTIRTANGASSDGSHIFTVLVNPDTYTVNYNINYKRPIKQQVKDPKIAVEKAPGADMSFEILFDTTGAFGVETINLKHGVTKDINRLATIALQGGNAEYEPSKVRVTWGALQFEGVLTSMDITYEHFSKAGIPLRATAKVTFYAMSGITVARREKGKFSKIIKGSVRARTVKSGERLSEICEQELGNASEQMRIAAENGLNSIRNLKIGGQILLK